MSPSEKIYVIFLIIVIILKLISFVPGVFDENWIASKFSAWVVVRGSGVTSRTSIWLWMRSQISSEEWNYFFTLFVLVAVSLISSIFSFIPLFGHMGGALVFSSFFSSLITAAATSVYFFYVISGFKLKLTAYDYIGSGMYVFLAAEAVEIVVLVTSVIVYNYHNNKTKWGRF